MHCILSHLLCDCWACAACRRCVCCVVQVSRMEAGDHWIVYGRVDDGVLQNDKELTAVMHRKVGNHY